MADFERDAEQLQSADFSDVEQFYLVVYWSRYVRDLFDAAVTHEKTTDEVELLNLMFEEFGAGLGMPSAALRLDIGQRPVRRRSDRVHRRAKPPQF